MCACAYHRGRCRYHERQGFALGSSSSSSSSSSACSFMAAGLWCLCSYPLLAILISSQRFTMVPFTRFRCSPRLKTRMTKTSKRTKQLSFSNLFLLRPAGAEVGRPGPQYRKLSAETWQDSQTSCAHMCTVSVVSQLISSISLSLCESRPGVAESNHRHGRGAEEEVAQIAPSQKAAQANCKIARTLPRVTSDQN